MDCQPLREKVIQKLYCKCNMKGLIPMEKQLYLPYSKRIVSMVYFDASQVFASLLSSWHVRRTRKAGQAQTHRHQTQTRQTDTNTTDRCNQIRRTQTEVRQDDNGQAKTQTKRPPNSKDHNSQSSKTNGQSHPPVPALQVFYPSNHQTLPT